MHFSFGGWAGVRFHHAVLCFVSSPLSPVAPLQSPGLTLDRCSVRRNGSNSATLSSSPDHTLSASSDSGLSSASLRTEGWARTPQPSQQERVELKRLLSGFGLDEMSRGCAAPDPPLLGPRSLARCRASRMDRSSVRPTSWTTRRWPRGTTCTAQTVWARCPHPITRAARTHCCRMASAAPAAQTSLMCSSTPDTPRRPGSISSSWSQLSSTCTCRRRMPRRSASTTTCRTCCLKPRVSRTNYFTVFSAAFQNFTHKFCCLSDSFQKPWQVKVLCVSSWKDFKQCYMLNQVAVQGNSCRLTCCLLWFIFTICIIFSVLYLKHSHQNNK